AAVHLAFRLSVTSRRASPPPRSASHNGPSAAQDFDCVFALITAQGADFIQKAAAALSASFFIARTTLCQTSPRLLALIFKATLTGFLFHLSQFDRSRAEFFSCYPFSILVKSGPAGSP